MRYNAFAAKRKAVHESKMLRFLMSKCEQLKGRQKNDGLDELRREAAGNGRGLSGSLLPGEGWQNIRSGASLL
jgi:hypothetical protein